MSNFFERFFETLLDNLSDFGFAVVNTGIMLAYVLGIAYLCATLSPAFTLLVIPCVLIHFTLLEMYS